MFSKNLMKSSNDFSKSYKHVNSDFQTSILSIVESQIIPHLHKIERRRTRHLSLISSSPALPSQKQIEIFVDRCISQDRKTSQAFVDHFINQGLNVQDIFLKLIVPAARYFGSQWENDRMDFSHINLGMVRLNAIANEMTSIYKDGLYIKGKVNRIMIATAPGSQHTLGATIVADFFRKAGWQVVVAISSSANELVQAVSNERFDVVGLSISIEQQLTNLADLISQLKSLSINSHVAILLGGPIFSLKELSASDFGADDICINAKHAVSLAQSLLNTSCF